MLFRSGDTSQPFDQRFITAMIAHHNGAIEMAREAQTKAEHPEIKQLAEAIIKAQEAEVAQLAPEAHEQGGRGDAAAEAGPGAYGARL